MIKYIFRDSLFKNSIYLMVTNFITSIIGFIFWIIAARYYSSTDIGMTSALFSSMTLISMVSSIGLSRALIFYLPRDKNADKIIGSCITINILSSIIFSIVFLLGINIWSPELNKILNNLENISIFIFITLSLSVSSLIGSAFSAGRRSSFQMIKESIYHSVKIFPLFLFINFGFIGILLSLGVGLFISIMVGCILIYKVWNFFPKLKLDPIIKNMARFSAGNYVADILYNLPRLVFPIIILNILPAKFAGYFYIAIMMASLVYGISLSISVSLLVESSDKNKFWNNVNNAIIFNLIILIPSILLFMIFGKFVLNIIKPDYGTNATTTLIILAITGLPLSLVNIFNTVRNSQNRVSSLIKMNFIIAFITIILSIPLIKIMNIEGIAISYLIANTVGAIIIINKIKNPKEFTLDIFEGIKRILVKILKTRQINVTK